MTERREWLPPRSTGWVAGNTDTLWAQLLLNNGSTTGWQKFTVVDAVTIAQGATLELANACARHAIFAGNAGKLQLEHNLSDLNRRGIPMRGEF